MLCDQKLVNVYFWIKVKIKTKVIAFRIQGN